MARKKRIFHDILRGLRETRKLTQFQLGQRAEIAAAAISHFETGARMPSPENLQRLADALGVSVDYLLGRADAPTATGELSMIVFRSLQAMSAEAQEQLRDFAKLLAAQEKKRRQAGGGKKT